MARDPTLKNVGLLATCQALAMSCGALTATITALAGYGLAEDKSLATLPLAFQFVGTVATTIPASLFMRQFGRRAGFSVGAIFGVLAGAVSMAALFVGSFALLCLGSMLFGVFNSHSQFYRFAAADTASDAFRSRAISLVMAGGVVAAFIGPELASWSRDLFAPVIFAGGYLAIAALAFLILLVLQFIEIPRPPPEVRASSGRPLSVIMRQPAFIVAVLAAMIGYGAMNLVMTATPLAVIACQHPFEAAALVIQWHVVGMYAPSFFTGHLIRKFGVHRIIGIGSLLVLGCVGVNLSGLEVLHFWTGLVLLGLGWNFMFVGGTTLLTECYEPAERAKVQAANDFLVFGTVTVTAFLSGAIFSSFGWQAVNLAVALPVASIAVLVAWFGWRRGTSVAVP